MRCIYTPVIGRLLIHPKSKEFEDDCPLCIEFEIIWLDDHIVFLKKDNFTDYSRPLMLAIFISLWNRNCHELIISTDNLTSVSYAEVVSVKGISALWKANLKKLKKRKIF